METPRKPLKNNLLSNLQQQDAGDGTPFKVPASPMMKSLGYGTGVNVYCLERSPRATGQARSPWAIKRVSRRTRTTNADNCKIFNKRILREADILRKLKHPNIVGFRAIAKENEGVESLALECCNTSVGTILEERDNNGEDALPAKHIMKVLHDVASALDYLHTEAMLLHGDVKSHNILVKGVFEICKLCDFGVSLPLNENGKIDFRKTPDLEYVGTNLWCAPEIIMEEPVIDGKTDIFSLGLVIYEMVTLRPPHVQDCCDDELNSSAESNYLTDLPYGTRPAIPQAFELGDEYNLAMELFYLCTNESPDERPSAKIIYEALKDKAECLNP